MIGSSWQRKKGIWGIWAKCSCWILATRTISENFSSFWEIRKRLTHVVTLPQGICHCLGICHLNHHLVEPVKKLSRWLLVSSQSICTLSRTHELGLACLDVWTLATLFCLNYFAANVGYKYLFLLHENNQRWESGKQPPIQQHGPTLFYRIVYSSFHKFCPKYAKTDSAPWEERHLFNMGLKSNPLKFFFSSPFPLFLLLLRCYFSFMFCGT